MISFLIINEHNQRLIFIDSSNLFWYMFLSDSKSSFITSSNWSFILISMLSLFECLSCSSSLSSLEKIKLIVIANWIFHVSDFLRSFMISFKYGLILLRYSSPDSVFLSPLLLYSIKLLLRKLFITTSL